ncbi:MULTISPECIES: hypothetical protein [Cylindrospermopsis]|uniref:Uncharacterized protein n=1 Tax=Cylindrospermopsis curvispora GIHE-G1 TaxID=2666332 RepID=A0A7H0EZB6_9CYAN|nr:MULTISPECIES: hypothetical protein [Cylindrospermopsis]QNP29132.1 hypothetical protein IAR63_15000 [Cylindrospermopsis curvispora GIHE-G1]UJL35052.1 hypothetical protein C6N34_007830 [Cylindrospermopsis raciborskii Cr2010]
MVNSDDILARIQKIESYLSTADARNNGPVMVTGACNMEKIIPVNISEEEIIEVYNEVPGVLLRNSIVTQLTDASYRDGDQPIILQPDDYGKYWLIVSDEDNIFVIPSIEVKSYIYRLKSMAKVFDFQGGSPSTDNHYLLIKPARFQTLPSGREWKMEEKGILEFTNHGGKDSLAKSLHKSIQNNQTNTNSEISKIHQELNKIKSQLEHISSQGDWQASISEIRDNQANTNLELMRANQQLDRQLNEIKSQLEQVTPQEDWQSLIWEIRDNQANTNLELRRANRQLDRQLNDISSQLEQLRSQDIRLQIDLLRVRLESLESRSSRD